MAVEADDGGALELPVELPSVGKVIAREEWFRVREGVADDVPRNLFNELGITHNLILKSNRGWR